MKKAFILTIFELLLVFASHAQVADDTSMYSNSRYADVDLSLELRGARSSINQNMILQKPMMTDENDQSTTFVVDSICYLVTSENEVSVINEIEYGYYRGDVIIPETVTYMDSNYKVTAIGNYAFCSCHELTSVVIPNTVEVVNAYAFAYCANLTDITFSNSLDIIGEQAFYGCI